METSPTLEQTGAVEHDFAEATLSDYELERGKPMPNKKHAVTQGNLMDALLPYKADYKRLPELSIRLEGQKYVPDIALYGLYASDWNEPETEMMIPPLLAIEIVSPSQSVDEMKAKADQYLAAGVKSVWLVFPALAGIMILQAERKPRFFSEGELVDEALDIRIVIDEVFE
jgi:Uma2 family endonuclease